MWMISFSNRKNVNSTKFVTDDWNMQQEVKHFERYEKQDIADKFIDHYPCSVNEYLLDGCCSENLNKIIICKNDPRFDLNNMIFQNLNDLNQIEKILKNNSEEASKKSKKMLFCFNDNDFIISATPCKQSNNDFLFDFDYWKNMLISEEDGFYNLYSYDFYLTLPSLLKEFEFLSK